MSEYDTNRGALDPGESDTNRSKDKPQELRSGAAKRALKSANEKLRWSTRHKNLAIWYEYNEYMVHHYAYVMKVAEVREPKSYVEASQDVKWRSTMEDEIWALAANRVGDLVDPPWHCKLIRCKWV